jgi:sugar phosphate isomerase/epimerase
MRQAEEPRTDPRRIIALAAGTGPKDDPVQHVLTAARAGYSAVGIRPLEGSARELASICQALDDTGLMCLDVEMVRLTTDTGIETAGPVLEQAAELGARHVVVVSREPNWRRTADLLAELCAATAPLGVRPAIEFMPFSAVWNLSDALRAAGEPAPGVIVDPLHLARSGSSPAALAGIEPEWFPYAQLCDAPASSPPPHHLNDEALHHRLLPGLGELPLTALLTALPTSLTLSIEIMSDTELAARGPLGLATAALEMTEELLARAGEVGNVRP